MFDWDKDFEEVTTTRPVIAPVAVAPSAHRGRIRRALLTYAMPLVVVGALWTATQQTAAAPGVAFAGVSMLGLLSTPVMPEGLRSYDQTQFDNFRAGIARFSDADLLAYAVATHRDHVESRLADQDWAHDMLILTNQEIDRRGLQRPSVMAALDAPARPAHPSPRNAI